MLNSYQKATILQRMATLQPCFDEFNYGKAHCLTADEFNALKQLNQKITFSLQVGKDRSAYKTTVSFEGNGASLEEALEKAFIAFNSLYIENGLKKRVIAKSNTSTQTLARAYS